MKQSRAQVIIGLAFLLGSAMTGTVAWHINREMVWNARFEERKRDREAIFASFEKCNGDTACEDKYRFAWFDLKSDQDLRDGEDQLKRIYAQYPYLRPREEPAPRVPSALM